MVETNLPILYLREVILLPYNEIRLEFTSSEDHKILGISEKYHDNHILLINLDDPLEEHPQIKDLPNLGIIGKIKSKIELPNGIIRTIITGIERVEITSYIETTEVFSAFVRQVKEYDYNAVEANALKRVLFRKLDEYINTSPYMSNNVIGRISDVKNINKLADIVISELPLDHKEMLKYVEITNPIYRIRTIIEDLTKEIETVRLENEIEDTLKIRVEEEQRQYMLREKIKLIKEELGELDLKEEDIQKIKEKIKKIDAPKAIIRRLNEELERYSLTSPSSPEVTTIRTYIDWLLSLPWTSSKDNNNIDKIEKALNESHFGLEEVKKRIIEYIAVKKKTKEGSAPILCLIGPPGVGKTTLACSIAEALNKNFVEMSVGGVNDEAEIVGHRRTYIGACPGKIIQNMKKAKTNNPVFLIDEIDKITKDYKGDPASALLEVLDSNQNNRFIDNYIEEEYDLSNVLFILTANTVSSIPEALLDRLEVIELSSYTIYEKINIAKQYIVPKFLNNYKLKNIKITDSGLEKIITSYTKEAGVRELHRKIDSIFRKIITSKEKREKYLIDEGDIEFYLGISKYNNTINDDNTKSGVVNGLAYTNYGGIILKITLACYEGEGNIILTGALGDIIKESVYIAISYIKSNCSEFGIDYKQFKNKDFHFHIEEGAIPKDGPSAGIAITTAIISLLKKQIVSNKITMTGEITLRGKILPVGGLREKLIAAVTNNIETIYLPKENEGQLKEIPENIVNKIKIILVSDYEEIFRDIFK